LLYQNNLLTELPELEVLEALPLNIDKILDLLLFKNRYNALKIIDIT